MNNRRTSMANELPPEFALVGELFEEQEAELIKSLLELSPGAPATLYLDSSGGSVYSALAVASLIKYRRLDLTGIVLGECSSATLLVFAACNKRLVTPRSVFLFHRMRWRSEKDVRSEEATNWAQHFQLLEQQVDQWQDQLFGITNGALNDWIKEGRFILAKELVDLGIAEMIDM